MLNLSKLKDKFLAAVGDKKAQGAMERHDLSERLYNNYKKFIGRSNEDQTFESIEDFLLRVNYTKDQINDILSDFRTKENSKTKLENSILFPIFDSCAAYAMHHGLYNP